MQRAIKGDESAFAELTLRLRPMVIQVIEEDLHIDIHQRDHKGNLTKSELIDELIAEGNLIILTRMKEVDYKSYPINSLRNILIEELQKVKRSYYIQRHDWQSSLDEILPRKHSRNTTRKEELISREGTPLDNLILQEIKSGILKRKKI